FRFVHSMMVVDRDGRMLGTTAEGDDASADYHDRTFFATLAHSPPGTLYIGKPIVRQDYRTFALARAIRDRRGAFAGVVLARISFEYLTSFYSTISTGDSSIRLVRDDGVVLARYPSEGPPSSDISKSLVASMRGPEMVSRDPRSSPDPRLRVLRRVQNY